MIRYPERIRRARLPTPVEPARRLSQKLGVELIIKRDDLTGAALSGNKIRKLEFLFAEAAAQGADTVITCGGEQSNHCRATAVAAAELGLRSYLLLRTDNPKEPPASEANILLDRLVGAEVRWVSRDEYKRRATLFVEIQGQLLAQRRKAYVIPEGGSNALGAWGYIGCVQELKEELGDGPLTIVYAAGSGGTGAGIILGIKLLNLPWRAVGVNVCDDKEYFVSAIGEIIEQAIQRWLLPIEFDREEIEILDGYVGLGYAKSRPEELATLRDVARAEGLILDPVYTGKAFHAMTQELTKNRGAFGERICFIHTGGIYGLFPKAKELEPLL
ncbi:MAG: pyridoxal phosphate-dependent enzyme D-cysteine desulfhydrase family [Myxococcales bacterium]|nr:pyridoxal phosphate-dependent enzyme D-cysteine desulfhydrase family [Myxococcales bacterium]